MAMACWADSMARSESPILRKYESCTKGPSQTPLVAKGLGERLGLD